MLYKLAKIEGIGETYSQKLKDVGFTHTLELLERGATPEGRKEIAEKSGLSDKLILRWVNMADLFRIKGVGEEYSDLLEAAGVDTVVELAQRNPDNLVVKLQEAQAKKNMVRRIPSIKEVRKWVDQAKTLPRVVKY
jgi:predicted flap endonuclease-1-like 5' DNA nuclease